MAVRNARQCGALSARAERYAEAGLIATMEAVALVNANGPEMAAAFISQARDVARTA